MNVLRYVLIVLVLIGIFVAGYFSWWPFIGPEAYQQPPTDEPAEEYQPKESEPISANYFDDERYQEFKEQLDHIKAGLGAEKFLHQAKFHASRYVETGDSMELELAKEATGISFKAACAYGDPETMVRVVDWMKEFRAKLELWSRIPQSQPDEPDDSEQDG